MAGQWLLLEVQGLGLRLAWDLKVTSSMLCICLGVRSIDHPNVLSEKINFSAPGGPKSAKFDPGHLDPIYFEVGNFLASRDLPYMSKNAKIC